MQTRYLFTGRELDAETGLYYYRARYYDASTGRFLSEDPVIRGVNLYTYVANNPVGLVDPYGLAPILGGGSPDPTPPQFPDPTTGDPVPIPYPTPQDTQGPPQTPVNLGDDAGTQTDSGISASNGDEAGTATGVASGTVMGPRRHITAALTPLVCGEPATRMFDVPAGP